MPLLLLYENLFSKMSYSFRNFVNICIQKLLCKRYTAFRFHYIAPAIDGFGRRCLSNETRCKTRLR